jgi:8-oxo-dGTP pyrophosphatase MutT (NUDIX family)
MGNKIDKNLMHYLVVTGILVNSEGKYLIVKRADWEKAFPSRWTVPGGKLEVLDYVLREKDTLFHWYNVFEDLLKREVEEEVGLEFEEVGYVTSLVYLRSDKIPCLIVSLYANSKSSNVRLCNALTEFAWVNLEEAKNYDLIEGIYEELEILDKRLKDGKKIAWGEKLKTG